MARWREPAGTGQTGVAPGQAAMAARRAAADVPGAHLWAIMAAWHVIDPGAEAGLLDTENLIMFTSVRCYKCGVEYAPGRPGDGCPEQLPRPRSWRSWRSRSRGT